MNEHQECVIQVLETVKGDDLYRARMAFKNLTLEQMNQEYGQGGKTCAQIIAEYEEHDARVNALIDWVSRQTGE